MAGKGKSKSAAKAEERGEARQPPPETHVQELDALRARYEQAVKELDDLLLQKHNAQLEPTPAEPKGWKDLPSEIRRMIYKYCFKDAKLYINDTVVNNNGVNWIDLRRSNASGTGGIARASKEIEDECMPVLYGQTTLVFNGVSQGPSQIYSIPRHLWKNQKYIKYIVVTTSLPSRVSHTGLRGFRALEVLRIQFRPLFMVPEITAGYGKHGYEIVSDNTLLTRYILRQKWMQWTYGDRFRWYSSIRYDALGKLYMAKTRTYRIEVAITVEYYTTSDEQEETTKVRAFTCI